MPDYVIVVRDVDTPRPEYTSGIIVTEIHVFEVSRCTEGNIVVYEESLLDVYIGLAHLGQLDRCAEAEG